MTPQEVEHYRNSFKDNAEMLLSNQGSILRPFVDEMDVEGEEASIVDQYGTSRGRRDEERRGDSPHMDVERARRWVHPATFDWGHLIERKDKLKQILDPTSKLTQGAVEGLGENIDYDVIIPAFFGDASVGAKGKETEAFDTNLAVPVTLQPDGTIGAATGMNVAKIIRGRKFLRQNKVKLEREEIFIAMTGEQEEELWFDAKATHGDFIEGRPFSRGSLDEALRVKFIFIEDLPVDGTGYRRNPLWVRSGITLGIEEELTVDFDPKRPDKKFMPYIYAKFTMDCTRTQQGKIIEVKNNEA